jgi:hypothetical protein
VNGKAGSPRDGQSNSAARVQQPGPGGDGECDKGVERWRDVPGFSGYEVSDFGRVHGPRGILRLHLGKRGYLIARLYAGSKKSRQERPVHALVMEAFVGPVAPGLEIDHLDTNKLNNRLSNLQYVSHAENMARAGAAGKLSRPGPRPWFRRESRLAWQLAWGQR